MLEDSELPCSLGGKITIFYSKQAAMAALPEPPEEEGGFWESAWSFTKGVGSGLWSGAKGTVTGVYDMAKWAGKHSLPYALANPEGFTEQLQQDKQMLQTLGGVAKDAGVWAYRNSSVNRALDPADWAQAQQENQQMFDNLMEKAGQMDAEEWGNLAGQGLFEAATVVGTGGVGAAAKAGKLGKLGKTANQLGRAGRAAENAEDVASTAKAAETVEDIGSGPRKLGEVYHVKSDNYAQKVLDNIDSQYFDKNNRFKDGFYVSQKGKTAIAEVTHHGGDMAQSKVIRFSMDKGKLKTLDLTDSKIAKEWKYDKALKFEQEVVDGIRDGNKYQKTIEISEKARAKGYNAIKFNSLRADGINTVIFDTPKAPINNVLSPEMIMPATN